MILGSLENEPVSTYIRPIHIKSTFRSGKVLVNTFSSFFLDQNQKDSTNKLKLKMHFTLVLHFYIRENWIGGWRNLIYRRGTIVAIMAWWGEKEGGGWFWADWAGIVGWYQQFCPVHKRDFFNLLLHIKFFTEISLGSNIRTFAHVFYECPLRFTHCLCRGEKYIIYLFKTLSCKNLSLQICFCAIFVSCILIHRVK